MGCEGLITIFTRFHKTSRSTAKKARLLPIMVPVARVYEKPWVWQANEAFQAVGLMLEGEIKGPLFRPPSMQGEGKLCERGISAEVSRFLRLSLGCTDALEAGGRKVSSHSLKRTCLSWASKAGLGKEVRALLERHTSAVSGTEAI